MHPTMLRTLCALLLFALPLPATAKAPKNAILLSKVQSLTLRGHGAETTHRRLPPVPQLKCLSSPKLCRLVDDIDVMRCENRGTGYDAQDIQWSCSASLPPEIKLGSTDVICEGYASSDDPYVLRGSCGVEYRVALTDEGEKRYPDLAGGGGGGAGGWGTWFGEDPKTREKTDASGWLFGIIFFAVLAWILYSACVAHGRNRRRGAAGAGRRPGGDGWGGWGGGGGGGGPGFQPWNDPPPPYPGTKSSPNANQQGWQPGFWTGLASGMAGGYMAGNMNNNRRNDDSYRGRNSGWGYGSGGSSWGTGSSSFGSAPSSSSSSARRETTGFGSTSRR